MRKFWVNSEGEFGFDEGSSLFYGGDYNVVKVLEESEVTSEEYMEMTSDEVGKLFTNYYLNDAKANLKPEEFDLLQHHNELSVLHTGFFRFNGGIYEKGPYLNLCFEFYLYQDEKDAIDRRKVDEFLRWLKNDKGVKFSICDMDEGIENEHSWTCDPKTYKKIEGSDNYGPNHGRPYKQFSVDVDLLTPKMKKTDVEPLIEELRTEMEKREILDRLVTVL